MALVESSMMELGTKAPGFNLLDTVSNEMKSLSELQSDVATVVVFICNHCPFVHHINSKLVEVANEYQLKGIQFVAISSNDVLAYPQDSPEKMKEVALTENYPFPYLYDESQEVAKAYQTECTPDFFVFDGDLQCVYRGRFDETCPNKGVSTGKELTNALDAILTKEKVFERQHPSMGCSIKWK